MNADIEDSPSNAAQFLNGISGYAITGGDDSYDGDPEVFSKQPSAAGGPFAGGPAALDNNNGFYPVDTASLAAGAKVAYANAAVGETGLFSIRYGKGTIVFLGYDWYESNPPDPAGADGGWIGILATAADIRPPPPVAPAPPVVVPPVVVSPSPVPAPSFEVIGARGSRSGKKIILRVRVGAPASWPAWARTATSGRRTPAPRRRSTPARTGWPTRRTTGSASRPPARRRCGCAARPARSRAASGGAGSSSASRRGTRSHGGGATQYRKNTVRIRGIR